MADVSLTADDAGGTRSARVGDTVVVSLPESPTSGYRWGVEELPPVLAPAGDEFVPAPASELGGGGTRVLRFRAGSPGEGRIVLRRWRSWEGEDSVVERFDAVIEVRA